MPTTLLPTPPSNFCMLQHLCTQNRLKSAVVVHMIMGSPYGRYLSTKHATFTETILIVRDKAKNKF